MATKFLPRLFATALVATGALLGSLAPTFATHRVTFLTNWFAQAEHSGFCQAKATGLYDRPGSTSRSRWAARKLPHFFGGLRISSGLALIGAVVAEFVAGTGGRSSGLAYEILDTGFTLDIPRMFAALFLITLTGVGLFGAMVILSKLALSDWHESEVGAET